jgi:prepilin-type N-terminal cleavage/methylation domain-containing protein
MLINVKKNKAFSLIEVIVATIIFLIASLGVFNVFFMAQKLSIISGKEVIAANYGRQLLEDLRAKVDQRTWDPPGSWYLDCSGIGPVWTSWPTAPTVSDAFYNLNGNALYQCTEDVNGLRKVTLKIVW